jgi:hypothetical protein
MARRAAIWMGAVVLAAAPGTVQPGFHAARGLELNPMHAAALDRAVAGAARRLDRPACRRVFAEFRDAAGAPLQDRLDSLGMGPADYLSLVVFADGSARRTCRRDDVLAVTAPGSRVVYVCGRVFNEAAARKASRAEIAVIHEALHTLGLGENPPDSLEITRRVAERCGD